MSGANMRAYERPKERIVAPGPSRVRGSRRNLFCSDVLPLRGHRSSNPYTADDSDWTARL